MGSNKNVEQIVEQTMLYDFYGELLTEHQKNIYEDVVLNDMSLTEIAQDYGISRQAVHDLMKRINRILDEYESKLHLVEKFERAKAKVKKIRAIAELYSEGDSLEMLSNQKLDIVSTMEEIKSISGSILEEF